MGIIKSILRFELINKFTHQCIFCGGFKKTKFVKGYGEYGELTWLGQWYHEECVRKICAEPEEYGHKIVDMAIDIIDREKEQKKLDDEEEERQKEQCKYIKEHCL